MRNPPLKPRNKLKDANFNIPNKAKKSMNEKRKTYPIAVFSKAQKNQTHHPTLKSRGRNQESNILIKRKKFNENIRRVK